MLFTSKWKAILPVILPRESNIPNFHLYSPSLSQTISPSTIFVDDAQWR